MTIRRVSRDTSSGLDRRRNELPMTTEDEHPLEEIVPSPEPERWGLCLSGGGYRAMLFHAGTLWRLDELGWLRRLDRISSVSGGSICAAVLGQSWDDLMASAAEPSRLRELVIEPLIRLAGCTLDLPSILSGLLGPGTVGARVARGYRRHLFGDRTLQDLPEHPRFVLNATNVQTGALWRFSRPYMGDYRVGLVHHPRVALAEAVAASSAFPPVLSPFELDLSGAVFDTDEWADLGRRPYRRRVVLTDGGVYDNLGIETAWKQCSHLLVSDAGGRFDADPSPARTWGRHTVRILAVIDNQVRALRKRQLIAAFRAKERAGAYWGIWGTGAKSVGGPGLECSPDAVRRLASVPTRLARLPIPVIHSLVNWGYAACDHALGRFVDPTLPRPAGFPFPEAGIDRW